MSKKSLTESDICDQYITPAIRNAGWDPSTQIRREYTLTAGRIRIHGQAATRSEGRRADYVLFYQHNLEIAVVEAKDNNHALGAGMQQALAYAEALDVPFALSSNGDGFLLHDRTGKTLPVEEQLSLDRFPSPEELWKRYRAAKGLTGPADSVARSPYYDDGSGKEPRYYQRIAIQRTIEAIARGQRRLLLVMATGTGKTYTAFQIIWRLWKAGQVKRTLFLADRNILIDQTYTNDFKPFGSVMTKVHNRTVDKSYEVYLALYQGISGTEDQKNIYKQFSPDFFDLVVIDECHRGSARDDSAWRDILDYFQPAIQLGMTATPKETQDVSTHSYFGDAVYTYSLKQGIDDGFLAPYKVVRIDLDKDLEGWTPPPGMKDDHGREVEVRTYNQRDMDRTLVLTERRKRVAEKVVEYLVATDPYAKTIVFCEDTEHASAMCTLLRNEVARRIPEEAANVAKFVVRITGDDNEGKRAIDDFIDPKRTYPVIATTSKLLGTGVDTKPCKLIVLDQRIESMIEFKQIVGRGTRVHEETGKYWFTIMDFKKATVLFADPDFDGEPVVVYEPKGDDSLVPPETAEPRDGDDGGAGEMVADTPGRNSRTKYVISDVGVSVAAERVQFRGADGKLVTESLKVYTRNAVLQRFASLDGFVRHWSAAERKQAVIDELAKLGVPLEDLGQVVGKDLDAFDLICHVVYDQPPLTRRERADKVKKRDVFGRFGPQARAVLEALLDKYADQGVVPNADLKVLRVQPLSDLGTPMELLKHFGGQQGYLAAVRELEDELYRTAA